MKRNVVLASLIFFSLSVVVYAFHHHDRSVSSASCSICTAKMSLSGTFGKNKIDAVHMAAISGFDWISFLSVSAFMPGYVARFIPFQIVPPCPNKAPPVTI